jgi:nuclear transport factor 2 (NTF2) superfamily protein
MTVRPSLPPFSRQTAMEKVWRAEDAWNTRDPLWHHQVTVLVRLSPAYRLTMWEAHPYMD